MHLFVEKPLSVKPPEEVQALSARLQELQKQHKLIIAVGYMLRYSPAVEVLSLLLEWRPDLICAHWRLAHDCYAP